MPSLVSTCFMLYMSSPVPLPAAYHQFNHTVSGTERGTFYLDPFSRIGEKYGGSWVENGRDRSSLFNGLPLTYINMNLAPTVGKQPTLMSVKDVAELFSSVRGFLFPRASSLDICRNINVFLNLRH